MKIVHNPKAFYIANIIKVHYRESAYSMLEWLKL